MKKAYVKNESLKMKGKKFEESGKTQLFRDNNLNRHNKLINGKRKRVRKNIRMRFFLLYEAHIEEQEEKERKKANEG